MPRVPLHALIWSQDHSRYDLYTQGELSQSFRPEDRNAWLSWLHDANSFAFQGVSGRLNVYLEERLRGGHYWYAYHTVDHRTRKRYLGQTALVTFVLLEEVAQALGSESSPAPRAPELGPDERIPHLQVRCFLGWRCSRSSSLIPCCPPGCWRGNAYCADSTRRASIG